VVVFFALFAEAVSDTDAAWSFLLNLAVVTPEPLGARDVGAEVPTNAGARVAVFSGNTAGVNRTLGARSARFVRPLVAWNDAVTRETLQSRRAKHPPAEIGGGVDGNPVNLIAARFG